MGASNSGRGCAAYPWGDRLRTLERNSGMRVNFCGSGLTRFRSYTLLTCLWNVIIACGMLLLLVEFSYCLWNVIISCGMLLLLVECYDSLWNVTIACGMLLLLVECYYCLWNVTIACGMLLLLVECYDSLWNVTIACGMLRDATCSLRSHWLARCARTGLFLRKTHGNLMKIYGNL